jgi:hypothetical protein
MTSEEQKLREVVSRIIEVRRQEQRISPSSIATEAMNELDPRKTAPSLVYLGCHLEIRQIARGLLRLNFEGREDPKDQHQLFPDLQWRYPTARSRYDEEHEYILREQMSDIDIAYNVERLRNEGRSKLKHADALEAYGRRRKAAA